jgi:hypothetical protein
MRLFFGAIFLAFGIKWLTRGETALGVAELGSAIGWILLGVSTGRGRPI